MKNLLKVFAIIAVLMFSFADTANAQVRLSSSSSTAQLHLNPLSAMEMYKNYRQSGEGCVGITIATNEANRKQVALNPPVTTWTVGTMQNYFNGLRSGNSQRFWSSRYNGGQPFAANKTDNVQLVMTKVGNKLNVKLIKNGTTTFPVKIYGVMSETNGHVFYGEYGTHGGFITISMYKAVCPAG